MEKIESVPDNKHVWLYTRKFATTGIVYTIRRSTLETIRVVTTDTGSLYLLSYFTHWGPIYQCKCNFCTAPAAALATLTEE